MKYVRVAVAACIISLSSCQYTLPDRSKVQLSYATIQGRFMRTEKGNTAYAYQGVPYALPPLGDRRFKRAVLPSAGSLGDNVIDATAYKAACMQNTSETTSPQDWIDEDCLHVNVFVSTGCGGPLVPGAENLQPCAVLYWIHGGIWQFDTPVMYHADIMVDNFASKGVVFVSVGYRLGALGFWTLPIGVMDAVQDGGQGNYGIHDTIVGLQWVQNEIARFGGDPNRVATLGLSSGATGVCLLTMLPMSAPLHHRAISMSGSSTVDDGASEFSIGRALARSQRFAVAAGCADDDEPWSAGSNTNWTAVLECMRSADALALIGVQRQLQEAEDLQFDEPNIDGSVFPRNVTALMSARPAKQLLIGTTTNEWPTVGADAFLVPNTTEENEALVEIALEQACRDRVTRMGFKQVGAVAGACFTHYVQMNASGADRLNQLSSDPTYFNVFREVDSMRAAAGAVYLYSFEYETWPGFKPPHAWDLHYLMGRLGHNLSAEEQKIETMYTGYFTEFTKTGQPTADFPLWSKWDSVRSPIGFNYWTVDVNPSNKPFYHTDTLDFWLTAAPAVDKGAAAVVALASEQQAAQGGALATVTESSATAVPPDNDNVDWQTGFWLLLAICIVLLCLLLSLCIYTKVERGRRAQRRLRSRQRRAAGGQQAPMGADFGSSVSVRAASDGGQRGIH